MTAEEKIAAKKIARIMRTARKELGLTQENVASRLGISQSALSKLEHATLIPSAPQWFDFCALTEIKTESLLSGYIERPAPANLEDGLRKGSFKLPKRYASHRGIKSRVILPLIHFLENSMGEKAAEAFFDQTKVDADYFIDLDNQINIQFALDLLRYVVQSGTLSESDLSRVSVIARTAAAHGSLHAGYAQAKTPVRRIEQLVANASHYTCSYRYTVDQKGADWIQVSAAPESHVDIRQLTADPQLGGMVCRYTQTYFAEVANYGVPEGQPGHRVRFAPHDCLFHGKADRCVYRLTFEG